ncbi:MAG: NAD(+) synthase [Bacteroidales bacterium]|jgi:NAD+ synthase (glutamine-hydrolysing)|nr:NAD(+) synthase [Bacteroidales bacterium]MDD3272987.1 NAD(+) synthase [Bacteroidales bacterium]MDD4057397.1 NAD(+) synthase [Bacteroidales bacterium]
MLNLNPQPLHDRIVYSIKRFFNEAGRERAVLGLSGGIDSALVASLAVEALGRENVHGILMPSPFSTVHSVTDSVELAENLGISYSILPIEGIFEKFQAELKDIFNDEPKRLVIENLQARIRGVALMAWTNQNASLLLNTSNKSEIAMGYGTLYGDLAGALMVIADLYKLQVYSVARYINREERIIPESILVKEPSAELSINQKDSDTLPEYSVLDPILYSLIEKKRSATDLIEEGCDISLINRIMHLINSSSFKAHQLPPMIRVGESPILPENKCVYYKID